MQERSIKEQLIWENTGLVYDVLERMRPRLPDGMSYQDAIQYGYLGLTEAAFRYDSSQGKFSTYAYIRIRGAIRDGVEEYRWFSSRRRKGDLPEVIHPEEERFVDRELTDSTLIGFEETILENTNLREAFDKLSPMEQYVVEELVINGRTFREIAALKDLGLSRVYVLYRGALKKLKKELIR